MNAKEANIIAENKKNELNKKYIEKEILLISDKIKEMAENGYFSLGLDWDLDREPPEIKEYFIELGYTVYPKKITWTKL